MSRGKASGYTLTRSDAKIVLGMQAREDREHDIAAWFGVNQARVAEVKGGKFGTACLGITAEGKLSEFSRRIVTKNSSIAPHAFEKHGSRENSDAMSSDTKRARQILPLTETADL